MAEKLPNGTDKGGNAGSNGTSIVEGLIDVTIPSNCTRYINIGNLSEVMEFGTPSSPSNLRKRKKDPADNLRGITEHFEKFDSYNGGYSLQPHLKWNRNASLKKGDPSLDVGKSKFVDGQRRHITTNWGFYIYDLVGYSSMYGIPLFEEPFAQEILSLPGENKPIAHELVLTPPSPEWKIDHNDSSCHMVAYKTQANWTQVKFLGAGALTTGDPIGAGIDPASWGTLAELMGMDDSPADLYTDYYARFYGEQGAYDATTNEFTPGMKYGYHHFQKRFLKRMAPIMAALPDEEQTWEQAHVPPLFIPTIYSIGTDPDANTPPWLNGYGVQGDLDNAMNHSHTVYMDSDMNGFTVNTIRHADSKWDAIADHVHPVINGKIMPIALHVYSPWSNQDGSGGVYIEGYGPASGPHWPLLFPPDVKWIHDHSRYTLGMPEKTTTTGGEQVWGDAGTWPEWCESQGNVWHEGSDDPGDSPGCYTPIVTTVIEEAVPEGDTYFEKQPIPIEEFGIPDKFMEMIELHHNTEMFTSIFDSNGLEKHPWFYGGAQEWKGKKDISVDSFGVGVSNLVPEGSVKAFLQADSSFSAFLSVLGTAQGEWYTEPEWYQGVEAASWPLEAAAYHINKVYTDYLNEADLDAKSHCVAGAVHKYSSNDPFIPGYWPTKEDGPYQELIRGIYLDFRTPDESLSPTIFEDHTYQTCGPPSPTGLKSEYNFHDITYEYQSHYIDKPWLPNLYLFALSQESPFLFNYWFMPGDQLNPYIDLFSFHKEISLTPHTPAEDAFYYKNGIGQYYKEWTTAVENAGPPGDKSPTQENTILGKTFFFDYSDFKLLRDHNYTKVMFPMYFEMFWNTPISQETKIIDIFAENTLLCEHLVASVYPVKGPSDVPGDPGNKTPEGVTIPPEFCEDFPQSCDWPVETADDKLFAKISKEEFINENPEQFPKGTTWDITKFVYHWAYAPPNWVPDFNGMHLETGELHPGAGTVVNSYNKLVNTIREKFRCIQDVFDGELAYNETVFFEVVKKSVWGEDTTLEQRYYFANPYGLDPETSTRSSLIEFIDTQIVYEEQYNYEVYAYSIIVGNKYHYVDHISFLGQPTYGNVMMNWGWGEMETYGHAIVPWSTKEDRTSHFKIINEPQVLLKKSHYASLGTISVSDDPPVPPDSIIYPYKDVKDKILIWLRTNVGEFDDTPVIILPEDVEKFTNIAISQGALVENGNAGDIIADTLIHFATDDPIKEYQIFRLDKKPKKWKDFAAGKIKLEEGVDAYLDTVEPNKKYYYTFRAVDFHDKVSNPSAIFEVELVHNSGATYPIINISQFAIEPTKTKQKNMRKYVHIGPTLEQSMLNAASPQAIQSATGAKPTFGSVFGHESDPRKFKVRFTSKSSGRKFDINLHFAHKHKNEVK